MTIALNTQVHPNSDPRQSLQVFQIKFLLSSTSLIFLNFDYAVIWLQISNPISNENILYAGSVVSTDIPKEEVKNSALSFELSDAAMIRMIVNNSIRCEVSVRSVEENPPNIFHCLWKFFSRK